MRKGDKIDRRIEIAIQLSGLYGEWSALLLVDSLVAAKRRALERKIFTLKSKRAALGKPEAAARARHTP